jgi:hypothetical protein
MFSSSAFNWWTTVASARHTGCRSFPITFCMPEHYTGPCAFVLFNAQFVLIPILLVVAVFQISKSSQTRFDIVAQWVSIGSTLSHCVMVLLTCGCTCPFRRRR